MAKCVLCSVLLSSIGCGDAVQVIQPTKATGGASAPAAEQELAVQKPSPQSSGGAVVHVRWAADVNDERKAQLEAKYALIAPERHEGRTWRYRLTNTTIENVRAMIGDPAVEDTQHIDRNTFHVTG